MAENKLPYATCSALEAMLDDGWTIELPVYARPHWRSTADSIPRHTYHFILWRESRVNLVSIPEGPEIQQFLAEHELTVDSL